MQFDYYSEFKASEDFGFFDFISIGKKGSFAKRVVFQPTAEIDIYNLAFGDILEDGSVNDFSISDNGDRNKILATVAQIVDRYTDKYPTRMILFSGSTIERTRLYRMALSINFLELNERYTIYGIVNEELFNFTPNHLAEAFLIKRKTL